MGFSHAGQQAPHPDAIRAHDHRALLAVSVLEGAAHGLAVARAQLEDVAHLHPAHRAHGRPTLRAGIPFTGGGNIQYLVGLVISPVIDVAQVIALSVGARHQVVTGRDGVIDDHQHVFQPHRRGIARHRPNRADLVLRGRAQRLGLERIGQLGLVDFHIAAHHREDKALAFGLAAWEGVFLLGDCRHHKHSLGGAGGRYTQEGGQIVDGLAVRCGHRLDRQQSFCSRQAFAHVGNLAVGREPARIAQQQRVFANRSEEHVLVGQLAAHHAGIRLDGDHRQPAAVENAEVGLVMVFVLAVQAFPIGIQAVAVFHGELAHPDQAGARAWVITELGLQVINELGQLAIGVDLAPHQVGHRFFVGHGQHHIAPRAILEATHLSVDLIPAAGLLPDIRRLDHRHGQLLAADGIHLLADDGLDLIHRPAGQRQIRENPGRQLADEPGPQQQLMAGYIRIGRRIAQRLAEQFRHSHRSPPV